MIQIIQSPILNRVLLDGNSTNIIISSSNSGAQHYFRAKIYINDVFFDEQSWSRKDNFTATKDLIYLYQAYFNINFTNNFANGLVEQTDLKKKVSIIINEHQIEDDAIVETLNIPDFFILYNIKSQEFNDQDKLTVLGLDSTHFNISNTGKIVIPFFANPEDESISVVTTLDTETVLNTETIAASYVARQLVYTYNLDNIAYNNLFVKTTITVGTTSKTFIYKIIRHQDYTIKEVVFKNNFGCYIPLYFHGQSSKNNSYNIQTYKDLDAQNKIYYIEETGVYKINTGYLLENETKAVLSIAKSLESFLNINNNYIPVNTTVKKLEEDKDSTHLFNYELTFSLIEDLPLDNNGFLPAPIITDITVSGNEFERFTISKAVFENAYTNEAALTSIIFDALPEAGEFKIVTPTAFVETIEANTPYLWANIDYFTFKSPAIDFSIVYNNTVFRLSNPYQFSNAATLLIDITDDPSLNFPPIITPEIGLFYIYLASNQSSATRTLTEIGVTDPETDALTYQWTLPDAPTGIVLSDATNIHPTLTVDQTATVNAVQVLRLVATDSNSNSTTKDFSVLVFQSNTVMSTNLDNTTDSQRTYNISIVDGIPAETIEIDFDYDVYSSNQYVAVFSDTIAEEQIISLINRKQTFTRTFDANGEVNFDITIEDSDYIPAALKITQLRPTGNSTVDKTTETITL